MRKEMTPEQRERFLAGIKRLVEQPYDANDDEDLPVEEDESDTETEHRLKLADRIREAERRLTERSINILKKSILAEGLDELLLIPLTPNGYVPGSWNCPDEDLDFEYDESDEVEYRNDENIIKVSEIDFQTKSYEMITRFGVYNNELYYHSTTSEVTNMGDLDVGELECDSWTDKWHPVSDLIGHPHLRALIIICLTKDGMWRFTKAHPECCFLHKSMKMLNAQKTD